MSDFTNDPKRGLTIFQHPKEQATPTSTSLRLLGKNSAVTGQSPNQNRSWLPATSLNLETRRVVPILDATLSRTEGWADVRQPIHKRMSDQVTAKGKIEARPIYYRGSENEGGEIIPMRHWTSNADELARFIDGISCRMGPTQIVPSIDKAFAFDPPPHAIILVTDACEEMFDNPEARTEQFKRIGKLAQDHKTRIFVCFDGPLKDVPNDLTLVTKLSQGAVLPFGSDLDLGAIFGAVLAFTAGGDEALRRLTSDTGPDGKAARQLKQILQLNGPQA